MKKKLLTERFQQLAGIKPLYEQLGPRMSNPRPTGPSDDNARPDINSKTLLDLIARDLKFSPMYQEEYKLTFEEAVKIMDLAIEIGGDDYGGQNALQDYIHDGEL